MIRVLELVSVTCNVIKSRGYIAATKSISHSQILFNHVVPEVAYELDEFSDGDVLFTLDANQTLTVGFLS